jgi:hypothetical protein
MRSPEVLLPTMIGRRGAQGGGGLKISSGRNRRFFRQAGDLFHWVGLGVK